MLCGDGTPEDVVGPQATEGQRGGKLYWALFETDVGEGEVAPLDNQQTIVRMLFICSQNKWRSPTAEAVFAEVAGVEALSAGTNHDAETPLSTDLVEWADILICMERVHQRKLQRDFANALKGKQVTVLGIKDNYRFMDAELVEHIKVKFPRWFRER